MKKIKNSITYLVKGLNRDKFIKKISKEITLYCVREIEYNLTEYKVDFFNEKKFEKALCENNLEIIKKNKKGLYFIFKNMLFNYGFLVGITFSIIFLCLISGKYLGSHIYGNTSITNQEILKVIEDAGIKKFDSIAGIDTKQIENMLLDKIDNISMVSVIKKGNFLLLNIKEKVVNDEYASLDKFEPIKSEFDGKVLSIELTQGTANVKKGDIIQKGDILVHNYIIDGSEEKRPIKPIAKIKILTWIEESVFYSENVILTERTGKTFTQTKLSFCNIPLNQGEECSFGMYETEISESKINMILPIKIENITYFELKERVLNIPLEENLENLKLECKKNTLQSLGEYDIIKDERYKLTGDCGNYKVTCILEIEKEIG